MSARTNGVRVFVRTRPTNNFAQEFIEYLPDKKTVNFHARKDTSRGIINNQQSDWTFKIDGVLHDVSQEEVYDEVARNVVLKALDGYNGTIMCYGQTGAGKTYTMTGATETYKQRGIIPRAIQQVFKEIENRSEQEITVRISFLEIYNESLSDLLATVSAYQPVDSQMTIVDEKNCIYVRGLSVHRANNEEEAFSLLFEGETNRVISSHSLNRYSSRSHCIFTIHIESRSRTLSDPRYVTSKLNLVDLAGSERLGKTRSEGQVLKEAMYINKSLTFLEQAILALADRKRDHVPFRQSKLTHVLKDSLGGNCNTILVANIYGDVEHMEETLSTLRFATRMKCIRTDPAVNEHYDPVLQVKKLEKDILLLKRELTMHDTLNNRSQVPYEALSESQIAEINKQVHKYLEGAIDEIEIINIRQIQEVFAQFKAVLLLHEQEVEARLLQKYGTADRIDSGVTEGAMKIGPAVDTTGELDGQGFGVGLAPSSARLLNSNLSSARKIKVKKTKDHLSPSRRDETGSLLAGKDLESIPPSKISYQLPSTKETVAGEQEVKSMVSHRPDSTGKEEPSLPSSFPSKVDAFEDFKLDSGSEINRIFEQNKAILLEKRRKVRQLVEEINIFKKEIDNTKLALQVKEQEREQQGQYINEEGDTIIDEEEFQLILKLKDLKASYRTHYDQLFSLRTEVQYCQHLVDQCRIRLLSEFDSWYNETFLIPEDIQRAVKTCGPLRPGMLPINRILALDEDDQERSERYHQELFSDSPGSLAFHSARMRNQQKQYYRNATAQAQPQRKKAGTVIPYIKNKPPSFLTAN
ncbi:kinesin-like protein KIF9 isoform X1 [Polypterus senegalus]|uniref:kinesin-like protein KIF9 isoform X1 n=1 Tax=Polypterus senegalus TaxID=55291 RepID=UPI0019657862|nr:kinesin-like protein KIF9 isoform X1 [Polypterus senegalus]